MPIAQHAERTDAEESQQMDRIADLLARCDAEIARVFGEPVRRTKMSSGPRRIRWSRPPQP